MLTDTDITASRPAPAPLVRNQPPSLDGAAQARTPLVLTSSRIGSFLACPRRHQWAYELGIRRDSEGSALTIGKAYHAALEAMNLGQSVDEALRIALQESANLDPTERTIAACMASGWHWRWSAATQVKRVLAVEQVFEFKPNRRARWSLAGKIDAIVELTDGRTAVSEYKTTRENIEATGDYWRRLLIDRQVSVYMLGAKSLGFTPDTVLYDAARVPGVRPRLLSRKSEERETQDQFAERLTLDIAERPDWYYVRREIPRIESDLAETETDLAHFAEMVRFSRRIGSWPRNTDACRRWGVCPYFGPCTANHNPAVDGIPSGYRRVEDVNVELTVNGGRTEADYGDDAEGTAE